MRAIAWIGVAVVMFLLARLVRLRAHRDQIRLSAAELSPFW